MKFSAVGLGTGIVLVALSGCEPGIQEGNNETKLKLLECSTNHRMSMQCDKLFEPNALAKNAQGDKVFVPGIKAVSLDFVYAYKDSMRLIWNFSCKSGCGGFNEFDEWWGSF